MLVNRLVEFRLGTVRVLVKVHSHRGREATAMSENVKDPWSEDEAEKAGTSAEEYGDLSGQEADRAGSTGQQYGNLSVEDDAQGTVDPGDLAGSGGSQDDGGHQHP
jgi:hypothetical protein